MDFMNRPNNRPAAAPAGTPTHRSRVKDGGLVKLASLVLFISVTILSLALIWFVVLGKPNSEAQQVDKGKLQAVFLTGGQVYFGHIQNLNEDYVQLKDIYYLRVNQQVQPDSNSSDQSTTPVLVPLGCELHRPQNEMLINRSQVIFWENLKDNQPQNTVPGAVKKFLKDNPNGQDCDKVTGKTN
jgi:hypothetical protein